MLLTKTIFGRSKGGKTLYQGKNFNTTVQNVGNLTFSPDGIYMYHNWHKGYTVRQYTLSTAWDITTAVYTRQGNIGVSQSRSITIKPDGTIMYVADAGLNLIRAYTLTTPYNINTMVVLNTFSVAVYDLKFSPDGLKMFTLSGTTLRQYSLSTAWNITTATLSITKTIAGSHGFTISTDGKTIICALGQQASRYIMNNSFDIATISFKNTITLPSIPNSNFTGILLSPDGYKLFWTGYLATPSIYQFQNTKPNVIG